MTASPSSTATVEPTSSPSGAVVLDERAALLALINTELDDVFHHAPAGEVLDGKPDRLRRRLFATTGTYPARAVFSGPGPCASPDLEDVGQSRSASR